MSDDSGYSIHDDGKVSTMTIKVTDIWSWSF